MPLSEIVYEVEMDASNLIRSQQDINNRLDQMEGKLRKTDATVGKFSGTLSKLAGVVAGALSVQAVSSYADAWATLSNKLSNSIRTGEQLADVTERVFKITQDSRASLQSTATLYSRLERGTRGYGVSTNDLIKITETVNKSFAISGATIAETESAIIQFAQGLASGTLRGEEFNSVSEQGSRLMVALADSLGVTIGELRVMAAQGKLTTDVIIKGLLSQGDKIAAEFAKTVGTIGQAMQTAGNNITKFVGESTTVKSTVSIFNSAIITLSENIDKVGAIIATVAAVIGSRYVGALTMAVAANVKLAATSYQVASAQGALAVASKAASGALALIGGPVGAAMLAGIAVFYFFQQAQQAKDEANDLADSLSGLLDKFKDMNSIQLASQVSKLELALPLLEEQAAEKKKQLDKINSSMVERERVIKRYGSNTRMGRNAQKALNNERHRANIIAEESAKADMRLSQTKNTANIGQAQLNGTMKTGTDLLGGNGQAVGNTTGIYRNFGRVLGDVTEEKEKFNHTSLMIKRDPKLQEMLEDLYKEGEALDEVNLKRREQLRIEQEFRRQGADENTIRIARENAGAIYDKRQAEMEANKETQSTAKVESQAAEEEKRRVKQLQELKDAISVTTLETKGLNREAAILEATQKLGAGATQQQIASMTALAGEEFDIHQLAKDKKAALDADSVANAVKLRNDDLAQLDRQLKAGDITFEQSQRRRLEIAGQYSKAIAEAAALKAITPRQENAAMIDPVQALANENARKLELIKQFEADKTITEQQAGALRNAAATQYEKQRQDAIWSMWSQQNEVNGFLASSLDSLASRSTNALTGLITGSQTASEAMANLAATITQEAVGALVKMGLQAVKNMIIGQTAATAATTATVAQALTVGSAWATPAALASLATSGANATPASAGITSVVGTANAMAVAGARKNGGPVSAGSMYRVGEGGKPEIFQSGSGRQYMIPGDNGKVISNSNMQSGNGIQLTVAPVFNIETGGGDFSQQDARVISNMVKSQVYGLVTDMQRQGGQLS
jgi:tape measure domain-containing protein